MDKQIVFYDIEVFVSDNLVVFYKLGEDGKTPIFLHAWWDDEPDRGKKIRNIVSSCVLCGYNNHHYDDIILNEMMMPGSSVRSIKARNDAIIRGGATSTPYTIESIDCMQQISVSTPSLKQIEGNIGISVEESTVDFNIDRKLTEAEREETVKYCRHDVEATIRVYLLRKASYFDIRQHLFDMMPPAKPGKERATYNANTTTLSARILLGDGQNGRRNDKAYNLPERALMTGDLGANIPDDVWDMWMDPIEHPTVDNGIVQMPVQKQVIHKMGGCTYVFGFGGLHGAPDKTGHYENVRLADVGSMYPSIIVATDALGDATGKYDDIRKERLKIKHTDKVRANALKLVLNSVYGNLKNQYNPLYSPVSAASVCIYGQIALFNLCILLNEAGYQIINANTDGVAFVTGRLQPSRTYEDIQEQWQSDFPGLVLELDTFDEWWQRDVNNYIATQNGHVKTKGGDVNKYNEDKPFDNNSLRIIQIALVECMVHGCDATDDIQILSVIQENLHDHPEWYQLILKAGSTYDGTVDEDGNQYQKVNRVFASKDGVRLYKKKPMTGGRVMFPDAPEHMIVMNGNIFPGCLSWDDVDITYYYKLAKKKIDAWRR